MKCLLNPISGEIKRVPDHEARKLAGYGWVYVAKNQYKAWKAKEIVQAVRKAS